MDFNGGLDERKKRILRAIIDDYISTAEPVGSRSIVKKYELGFSSATIRNEMADLEDMGYIDQPHTSAGRVPSDKGYRFYVDQLMKKKELSINEMKAIKDAMEIKINELNQIIKQASIAMSNITSYTSVATTPKTRKTSIKAIQLVPLDKGKALTVLVTSSGEIKNSIIKIKDDIQPDYLINISNILNEKLNGLTIEEISLKIIKEIEDEIGKAKEILIPVLGQVVDGIRHLDDIDLYLDGTTNILKYPEFGDIIKAKGFLDILTEKDVIYDLIDLKSDVKPITIKIGDENTIDQMKGCSIITTTYSMGDVVIGSIGIVGPKRMEYAKVISTIEYIKKKVNSEITKFLNKNNNE